MAGVKSKSDKKAVQLKVAPKSKRQVVDRAQNQTQIDAKKRKFEPFKRTPKHERPVRAKLTSAPKLLAKSCLLLLSNWKLFAIILGFYVLLYVVLVGGLSGNNLSAVKAGLIAGHVNGSALTTQLFSTLISSGNNGNTVPGVYETFLLLFISLVLIWAIRKVIDGKPIRARDAFYNGVYPFVPFLLIMLVIGLQLIPMVFGGAVYNAVASGGVTKGLLQSGIGMIIFFALMALSLYWVASSIIALYISTHPDTTPMQALRAARDLVRFRRIEILRKLLFLPIVIFLSSVIILMPIARYATSIAALVFFGIVTVSLALVHTYMYSLYRELT